MSVLAPATRRLLATVRACKPLFSNMIAAELFDGENTRGDLKILPTTEGGYVVLDVTAPNGQGVRATAPNLALAQAALEKLSPQPGRKKRVTGRKDSR